MTMTDIKSTRIRLNLKVAFVAERIGMSPASVYMFEADKRHFKTLKSLKNINKLREFYMEYEINLRMKAKGVDFILI